MTETQDRANLAPPPIVDAKTIALFADLDGTLAGIEPRPGDVKPDPERRRMLEALERALDGRVAIVSGRALDDLDRVLEGRVPALAAVHGLVRRRADGVVIGGGEQPGMADTVGAFRAFAARHPGVIVEDKGEAATLHYRLAPKTKSACLELATDMAERHGLAIQPGDQVAEVRNPGLDKGGAVKAFMAEPPFAGAIPVYVGDDLTDEHGFAAVQALGGFGVVVGDRRPTIARFALPDVQSVYDWLWSIARKTA